MNTHSKMKCPISEEDITIVSYPPYGSSWSGWAGGRSEVICPHKVNRSFPICRKESGYVYLRGPSENRNVCIMEN